MLKGLARLKSAGAGVRVSGRGSGGSLNSEAGGSVNLTKGAVIVSNMMRVTLTT